MAALFVSEAERERLFAAMQQMAGVEVFPSSANLLIVRVKDAAALWRALLDAGVLVRNLDNGNYELQVHIADVAQYVTPDAALDREARLRGTSVYFPDRAIPMLPLELSTDICSLRPELERLVLSCIMEIDHSGEIGQIFLALGYVFGSV